MNKHADAALLDQVGTNAEIARLFEVTVQAVHQWRLNGIPRARMQTLRLMRPELFPQLIRQPTEQEHKGQEVASTRWHAAA